MGDEPRRAGHEINFHRRREEEFIGYSTGGGGPRFAFRSATREYYLRPSLNFEALASGSPGSFRCIPHVQGLLSELSSRCGSYAILSVRF